MAAPNRRLERTALVPEVAKHVAATRLFDLTVYENHEKFLEGTGSMVLDRVHRIAYACASPRTDEDVLNEWCRNMNYEPVLFHAEYDRQPVYHTNVVLSVGNAVAVCCLDAVTDEDERLSLAQRLSERRTLMAITPEQLQRFTCNMLLVRSKANQPFWVMSQVALMSLNDDQKAMLEKDGALLALDLDTIETFGGGSARCMLAEVGW
jgi:hypothetical protein